MDGGIFWFYTIPDEQWNTIAANTNKNLAIFLIGMELLNLQLFNSEYVALYPANIYSMIWNLGLRDSSDRETNYVDFLILSNISKKKTVNKIDSSRLLDPKHGRVHMSRI